MFQGVSSGGALGSKAQSSTSGVRTYPFCEECGKSLQGVCRSGSDVCFGCSEPGHRMREYRVLAQRGRLSALQALLDWEGFPEIDSRYVISPSSL